MSLVYLISKFEGFLAKNLEILFTRIPDTIIRKNKNASFEIIFKSKNLDEIIDRVIGDEISKIFRKDIEDINDDYKEFAKLDLSKEIDWTQLKEFFYRRNIILHNNGKTNLIYKEKTGSTANKVQLSVDEDYLLKAIDLFEKYSNIVATHFKNKFVKS